MEQIISSKGSSQMFLEAAKSFVFRGNAHKKWNVKQAFMAKCLLEQIVQDYQH